MKLFFPFLKKVFFISIILLVAGQVKSENNSESLPNPDSSEIKNNTNIRRIQYKVEEYKTLISNYSEKNDFRDALNYQNELIKLQDSVIILEKIVALTNLQQRFEAEQSKNEVKLMNAQNESQMAFLDRQKLQRYGFLAGGTFLVLIVIGLFSRLRFLRNAKIKMEEQNKRIAAEKLRAEESEKIREQFLSKMSHEIRTPLSSIMGMSHILRKNNHLDSQEKYFDAIWKSSENLLVILNDIIDLSRLESGKIVIERIAFQPVDELMKLRELLKYKAEEKGINLNCDLHPDIPKVLIGDPVRLNQVLLNLTGNAIKFTEKGSIKVSIRLKEIIEKQAIIECIVKDTGIGIPKDRLDKIFESFTQADSETTRKYGGTGLGLTISKQLLQLQNGSISVESVPGEGSRFCFTIPYEIGGQQVMPEAEAKLSDKNLSDLNILVVEDNQFNIMVVSEELNSFIDNLIIETAENGKIAVEKVAANEYDLILMDIEMLEMNGYEAARAIRKLDSAKSKIPIIAMTAKVMKDEIQHCFDAGMNDFISKPFNPEDLKIKVQNLVYKTLSENE